MVSGLDTRQTDPLAAWAAGTTRRARLGAARRADALRFAFYARVSTTGYQDPASSRRWQWDVATELIAGRGRIVAEFIDVGYTRELSWTDRPQAAALLAAAVNPDRGFDAIVVGEYARAFSGSQILHLAPLLHQHGVQLWIPETDGPIDVGDPGHRALLMQLGAQAKHEVQRARFRTIMAMQAQTRDQGRYLGGRPPYGYRLVDAGPHPNRVHAEWGRRLHRLEPDPATAPHVTWIFAQRLAEHSIASIARSLNERGVPCPSAADPRRNPHRSGRSWCLRTVAAILANPRYTGRQVWNRQRRDYQRTEAPLPGMMQAHQLTAGTQWAISTRPAHPALVSEQDFLAAQAISALHRPADGSRRRYQLTGLLRCGSCGRSLESQWSHGKPCYRCRHGHTTARQSTGRRVVNLHLREDVILARAFALLSQARGRDAATEERLARLQRSRTPRDVIEFLRRADITIVCHGDRISLDADSVRVVIESVSPDAQGAKIPRQRRCADASACAYR